MSPIGGSDWEPTVLLGAINDGSLSTTSIRTSKGYTRDAYVESVLVENLSAFDIVVENSPGQSTILSGERREVPFHGKNTRHVTIRADGGNIGASEIVLTFRIVDPPGDE